MPDAIPEILKFILTICAIWVFVSYFIIPPRNLSVVHSRWYHLFDSTQLSGVSIYDSIETAIRERNIPNLRIDRPTYKANNILDPYRTYLRIKRKDKIFLICASPFGNSFFVSWWFGDQATFARDFWPRIPYVGKAIAKWLLYQTFYQSDSDTMFKETVSLCVNKVLDGVTQSHSLRGLSEAERKSIDESYLA